MKGIVMKFETDTKNYHKFRVLTADGSVTGNVYFRKEDFPQGTPKELLIRVNGQDNRST